MEGVDVVLVECGCGVVCCAVACDASLVQHRYRERPVTGVGKPSPYRYSLAAGTVVLCVCSIPSRRCRTSAAAAAAPALMV